MGHNLDLQWLLGLPEYVCCHVCKEMTKTWFEEYDIDCDSPQAQNGKMMLMIQCAHCEAEFTFYVTVKYDEN